MYSDIRKKSLRWLLAVLALLLLLTVLLTFVSGRTTRNLTRDSAAAIQETIQRSALQCYAVEGVYPPNLAYLEENYGLEVNSGDFYIHYEAFASNLPPTVVVKSIHGEDRP